MWLAPARLTATDNQVLVHPTIANIGVEGMMQIYAKQYGVSLSVAKRIIGCEDSGDAKAPGNPNAIRFNKNKAGVVWSRDIGYWQINDFYWQKRLAEMGWDINNPEQNLQAGFWILSHYGTTPWKWSQACWG